MKTGWKQKSILFMLLLGIAGCFFRGEFLKAASSSVVLTTKETAVDRGDKVHVILSIESDSEIGNFEAYVKYDKAYLQFITGGSYIQEEGDLLKISHMDETEGGKSRKYAMEFRALKRGKSKVALKDDLTITELESGSAMSLSTNELTVAIAKPAPTPSPKTTVKPITLPQEETVVKKESPSPTVLEEPEDVTVQLLKKGTRLILKGNYEYTIVEVKKKQYIPKGYVSTKIKIDGTTVTAYRNLKNDSDFVLLYVQNASDEFGYYQYDAKEKTMQRYQKESIESSSESIWSPDETILDSYRKKVRSLYIVVGVFAILLVVLSLLLACLLRKKQRD